MITKQRKSLILTRTLYHIPCIFASKNLLYKKISFDFRFSLSDRISVDEKNFSLIPKKVAALSMQLIVIIYRILVIILGGVELWIREKKREKSLYFQAFFECGKENKICGRKVEEKCG